MQKKALIVYDTRYGATEQIANWIAEGINDADIKHVDNVSGTIYELIVVGSPIYNDQPTSKIIEFLEKNKESLANKKLALFTVNMPMNITSEKAKKFMGTGLIDKLAAHVKGNIIASKAFLGKIELRELSQLDMLSLKLSYFLKGYNLRDVNYMDREEAFKWGNSLYNMLVKPKETEISQPSQQQESKKS